VPSGVKQVLVLQSSGKAGYNNLSENRNQTSGEGDMSPIYNVYCDESCHLERDRQPVMVLGAVWCPLEKSREISVRIREIKTSHGLSQKFESKWTKVSPARQLFYGHTHDTWYYKMYFDMLKAILDPEACYRIYLDIKDTRSAAKIAKLHDVLCSSMYDFGSQVIERVQTVRSHEVEILQITDLLIGAVSYVNRGLHENAAKLAVVERMIERSSYSLTRTTLLRENKVNLFMWQASEIQG
jgi:hypothetical protein